MFLCVFLKSSDRWQIKGKKAQNSCSVCWADDPEGHGVFCGQEHCRLERDHSHCSRRKTNSPNNFIDLQKPFSLTRGSAARGSFNCKINSMDLLNTDLFLRHCLKMYNGILSMYLSHEVLFSWTIHQHLRSKLSLFIGLDLLRFGLNPFSTVAKYYKKQSKNKWLISPWELICACKCIIYTPKCFVCSYEWLNKSVFSALLLLGPNKAFPPFPWSFAMLFALSDILICELQLILCASLLECEAWLIGLKGGVVWLFQVSLCQLRGWQLSWDQSAGSVSSDLCPLRSPGFYMKPAFLSRNFLCLCLVLSKKEKMTQITKNVLMLCL